MPILCHWHGTVSFVRFFFIWQCFRLGALILARRFKYISYINPIANCLDKIAHAFCLKIKLSWKKSWLCSFSVIFLEMTFFVLCYALKFLPNDSHPKVCVAMYMSTYRLLYLLEVHTLVLESGFRRKSETDLLWQKAIFLLRDCVSHHWRGIAF